MSTARAVWLRRVAALVIVLPAALVFSCTAISPHPETGRALLELGAATLSSEFPVDRPLSRGASAWGVELVPGAVGYLAATTMAADPEHSGAAAPDVVVTPVSADGVVLEPLGRVLTTGVRPRVVHAGSHFLMILEREREANCALVRDDGTLVAGPKPLGFEFTAQDLEFDGTNVFVLGFDGHGFLIDSSCALVTLPAQITATAPDIDYLAPSAAFDGTNFLVGYTNVHVGSPDEFVVQRVTRAGALAGSPVTIALAEWARSSFASNDMRGIYGSVASQSGTTLVAYTPQRYDSVARLIVNGTSHYRTLAQNGNLGPEKTPVPFALPGPTDVLRVDPAGDGFWLTSDSSGGQPFVAKTDLNGTQVARFGIVANWIAGGPPGVASRGGELVLVRAGKFWRYSATASPLSGPTEILFKANEQQAASVATAGGVRLVVWNEPSVGIYASRVAANDQILDEEPMFVHGPASSVQPGKAASNGRDFLVGALLDGSGSSLEVRRVASSGVLMAGSLVLGSSAGVFDIGPFDIGSDGTDYLVAWAQWFGNQEGNKLLVARVSADGVLLSPTPVVVAENVFPHGVEVAYDGSDYVVAYDDRDRSLPIGIVRVERDGTAQETETTPFLGWLGGFAWGKTSGFLDYFVADTTSSTRMGAVVPPRGGSFAPSVTLTTTPAPSDASVAWDGTNFWVAWQDYRRGPIAPGNGGTHYGDDVYTTRVTPSGTVLEPGGVLVTLGEHFRDPQVALSSESGRVFAAYSRYDPAHGYRTVRLRGRVFSSESDGGSGGGGSAGEGGATTGGTAGSGTTGGRGGTLGGGRSGTGGTSNAGTGGEAGEAGAGASSGGPSTGGGSSGGASTAGTGASPLGGEAGDGSEPHDRARSRARDDGGCATSPSAPSGRGVGFGVLFAFALASLRRRYARPFGK